VRFELGTSGIKRQHTTIWPKGIAMKVVGTGIDLTGHRKSRS